MDTLLEYLVTEPPESAAVTSVSDAWERHQRLLSRFGTPVDLAAAAGFGVDRLGFAFLSGYRAALQTLLPDLPSDRMVALCATEAGGGHPRAIQTVYSAGTVTGTKSFVTLGSHAQLLIVVAGTGTNSDGRNQLVAVTVDPAKPGVHLEDRPPLPFAPEVPHAVLTLDGVQVDEVLPGDAYRRYVKPFRTVEDSHVLAAAVGWLVSVARRSNWPADTVERMLAVLAAVRSVATAEPSSPGVHIALGGVFRQLADVLADAENYWAQTDFDIGANWERDRPLLSIAGTVRARRLETAWRSVDPLANRSR